MVVIIVVTIIIIMNIVIAIIIIIILSSIISSSISSSIIMGAEADNPEPNYSDRASGFAVPLCTARPPPANNNKLMNMIEENMF